MIERANISGFVTPGLLYFYNISPQFSQNHAAEVTLFITQIKNSGKIRHRYLLPRFLQLSELFRQCFINCQTTTSMNNTALGIIMENHLHKTYTLFPTVLSISPPAHQPLKKY
jgi:hypothetical protein